MATETRKPKKTLVGLELVRLLKREGDRIFTTARARELAPRVGMKQSYVVEALHHLARNDWIVPLRRGTYVLSADYSPGYPIAEEFEIATNLVNPSMVSHFSAMSFHGLTVQIPWDVTVSTTPRWLPRLTSAISSRPVYGYLVRGIKYRVVRIKPELFFGVEKFWVHDTQVPFTDFERTLIDGLCAPQHCGAFGEVIGAFEEAYERMNFDRLIEYAVRIGGATPKRLGWVLEAVDVAPSCVLDKLAALPAIEGYPKLDPSGPHRGPNNDRWKIQMNL